jgi:spermidine synthase
MRAGLVPSVLGDPRVEIRTGDVRDVVRTMSGLDGILLDVDNGPDHLVYAGNAVIYRHDFLADCHRVLRSGGVLTVWSSTSSEQLESEIRSVFGTCTVGRVAVDLQNRPEHYYVYTGVVR